MKKTLLLLVAAVSFSYAGVEATTVGCVNKEDLNKLGEAVNSDQSNGMNDLNKFLGQYNCDVIEPDDKISQIGKPTSDGFIYINVDRLNKSLYIKSDKVKSTYNKDNNMLNKSF